MQVELLAEPVRDGYGPRRRTDTHTHMGRTSRAGQEWRVVMVLRRVTSRPRWYRLLRRTCFHLREIVTLQARCFTTAGSYGSGQRDHGEGYYHSTCLAIMDCTCHLQTQHNNILFSKTTAVLSPAHSAVNWQEWKRSCELVSKI